MRERAGFSFASRTQCEVRSWFCVDRIVLPHALFSLVRTQKFWRRSSRSWLGKRIRNGEKNERENDAPAGGNSEIWALPHFRESHCQRSAAHTGHRCHATQSGR